MMRINWHLALIVLMIIPVIIIVAVFFQRRIITEYRNVRRINRRLRGATTRRSRACGAYQGPQPEQENMEQFGHQTDEMYRAGYRAAWLSALFLPTVQLIGAVAIGSIVLYTGATEGDTYDV